MKYYQKGFTITEIVVAMLIAIVIVALLFPIYIYKSEQHQINATKNTIQKLQISLNLYKQDNGIYPTQTQGLRALIAEPNVPPIPTNWRFGGYWWRYLPVDAWGRQFIYRNPGQFGPVDIISLGPPKHHIGVTRGPIISQWGEQKPQ